MKVHQLKQGDQLVKDESTYQVAGKVIVATEPNVNNTIMLQFQDGTNSWYDPDDEVQTMAESWRVDCTDDNSGWATNAMVYKTKELAEEWAVDLSMRWFALRGYRIVPALHPDREKVDYETTAAAGFIMRNFS